MKAILPLEIDLSDGLKVETPPLSTKRAIETAQSGPAAPGAGPFIYNQTAINDDSGPTGDGRTMGRYAQVNVGGPNSTGGKYGDFVTLRKWLASVNAGDAIAHVAQTYSNVADGGAGELYGSNSVCHADTGCVTPGVNGVEFDVKIMTGATVQRRSGVRVVNEGNAVASGHDAAYSVMSTMSGGGFKTGVLLSTHFGQAPLQPDGDVFGVEGAQTVAKVLNLTNLTVTGHIVYSTNFKVTGAGALTLAGPITINNAIPEVVLYENDAAADCRYWDIYVQGGVLKIDAVNDAFTSRVNVLTLGRAKPIVTGSRSSGAALTSLLTSLAQLGLITDGTTP